MDARNKTFIIPTSLTHNTGIITAVVNGATYSVALSGLVANQRYQLYLINGGTLVYSVNENSVGPAGATSYILIGSFYANGLTSVTFGSFCTIEGAPTTNPIPYTATLSNLGVASQNLEWMRQGKRFLIDFRINMGTGGGGGAAFSLPFTQAFNSTGVFIGKWNGDAAIPSGILAWSSSQPTLALFGNDAANWGSNITGSAIGNNAFLTGYINMQASEFSNTPIKDL